LHESVAGWEEGEAGNESFSFMGKQKKYESELESLFLQAVQYDRAGDVYNAVKLHKRLTRLAPDWSEPYACLSRIYKNRQEWRPAYYYAKRAAEINPFNESAWQNLGIAATAIGNWTTARHAWNHLGYHFEPGDQAIQSDLGVVPVCLNPDTLPEIVWARRIDPARAVVLSVPQPRSKRRYGDVVLLDQEKRRVRVLGKKRLVIYDELELLASSRHATFCAFLLSDDPADLDLLERLCRDASVGFDNWSGANRLLLPRHAHGVQEIFDRQVFEEEKAEHKGFWVALAAREESAVRGVLEAWQVVSLKKYCRLVCMLR